MKYLQSIVIFAFLISGLSNLSGQAVPIITNYTTAEGLPSENVICVATDGSDVWFGTQDGIAKFEANNNNWTIYNQSNYPDIPNNEIKAIAVDHNHHVWIGTDFGLAVFDGAIWTKYTKSDGLGSDRINYITPVSNGDIWISDFNGATKFDGSDFTSYGRNDGLPFGGVEYIDEDSHGDIWMGTGLGGLIKYDGKGFTEYTESEGLISNVVSSVAVDQHDNKWVGTSDGISVFNSANNWVTDHTIMLILPAPDTLNPVVDLKLDSKGIVWTGIYVDYLLTEGGVAYFDQGEWHDIDVSDGLIAPTVRKIDIDDKDQVWVATSKGVSRINLDMTDANQEIESNEPYRIYPNPSTNEIMITNFGQSNDYNEIQIFNSSMKEVKINSVSLTTDGVKLSLIGNDPGMYFIRINGMLKKILLM